MATVTLNDRGVANIAPQAAQVDVWDMKITGLGLRVSPSGVKAWTLRYRIGRRMRRWTIGRYPTVTLAKARASARKALRNIEDGIDPALEKKERREANTFGELADLYLKAAEKTKRSWKDDRRRLKTHARPLWKHRPAREITRRDVRDLLETIAETAPIEANRIRALLHTLFQFGLSREIVTVNPVAGLERPGQEQWRDRVLTDDEIRALWPTLDALPPQMAAFYKLRLLTAQRGGEVASMRWQDVDLEGGWWTIPATVAKNKLAHRCPLSPAAIDIIKALKPITTDSQTVSKRAVYVLNGARGKRQQAEAAATFSSIPDFRGHDLRRTAASLMAGGGIPRLVISKILNHAESGITAVYDRHSYDAEKQAALAWWALKLHAILDEKSATVLPFTKRSEIA